jgi:hypothetical protein
VKHKGFGSSVDGLTTSGEFGPILGTALLDAAKGNLVWNHWEQGMAGPEAVYSYEISAPDSHYKVDKQTAAYSGEIAVDPATGAILRLVLKSEMDPAFWPFYTGPGLIVADLEVEYGPVALGTRSFLCPLKGVALSRNSHQLWLNDVVFDEYHLFTGETRILPGFGEVH